MVSADFIYEAWGQVTDQGTARRKVLLRVTSENIEVCDRKGDAILNSTPIGLTAYCGAHPTDKRIFAYTTNSALGLFYCHVFEVKVKMGELMQDFGSTFAVLKTRPPVPPPLPPRSDMHFYDGFYMGFAKARPVPWVRWAAGCLFPADTPAFFWMNVLRRHR